MQIDIPTDLLKRLHERSEDPVKAIREALDNLDSRDRELAAIRAGLASADAGNVRPFDDFDLEFRTRNGVD